MNFTWEAIFKGLIISLPVLGLFWKAIDKYFEYQAKKDKELIKEVVEQLINGPLNEIKTDIKEIRDQRDKDMVRFHDRVDMIFREVKK